MDVITGMKGAMEAVALRGVLAQMQGDIGAHLQKHGGNALESSSRSYAFVVNLSTALEMVMGPAPAHKAENQGPLYRYTCPSGHGWAFLAEYTECPFCGMAGARGEVWDGTWPAREG